MGYTHINITERSQLERLLRLGWSNREIGKELGRHHFTIARERKRGSCGVTYAAEIAQASYTERRVSCKPKGRFTIELASELETNLQQTWSPEQMAEHRRINGKTFVCLRMYLALKMPDRTAHSMEIAFGVIASQYPHQTFLTATAYRGKEFACYAALETFHGLDIYFADPYSSWQRGSNENGNGLREFFPKGYDFAQVSDEELAHAIHLINDRPRKCLGWKSAHESFVEQLSHLD